MQRFTSMSLQLIIVVFVIMLSAAYLAYRIWKTLREASDPCHGCPGCARRDQSKMRSRHKGLAKDIGQSMRKNSMKPPC